MTTIRHLHSSSRFDRTPLSLLTLVKAFLGRTDLITLTEVGNNTRVKALKRLPGWTFTQIEGSTPPGGDECAILTRDAALTVIASEAVQLTKLPSSVPTRRVYSADATVQTPAGERALVSVVHFPAHIETGDTLGGRPIDVAAWKDSMSTWARHLEKARLKGLHIIAPADFNTNIKRAPHRERIDKLMPHLKSAWYVGGFPSRGTHGSRLIDDTRTTLDIDTVRLVNTFKSSDHIAYMATLAFPKETPVSGIYLEDHKPRVRQFRPRTATVSGVIVVHTAEGVMDTVGPDTGAEGVASFIANRTTFGSYHRLVDSDSIVPLVRLSQQAYGDGTGSNPHAIHISFACKTTDWVKMSAEKRARFLRNGAKAAAEAAKYVRDQTGRVVPDRQITRAQSETRTPGFISHGARDPGRRSDPGAQFPWAEFLRYYAEAMGAKPAAKPKPKPVGSPEFDDFWKRANDIATNPKRSRRKRAAAAIIRAAAAPFANKEK